MVGKREAVFFLAVAAVFMLFFASNVAAGGNDWGWHGNAVCGDGHLQGDEQCDFGALNGYECWPGYGSSCTYCTSDCKLETITNYCGDGIQQSCEQCDLGSQNGVPGSGCSLNCTLTNQTPVCGNGILEQGEQCDFGSQNGQPGSTCSSTCTIIPPSPTCGNSLVESGELCDGNTQGCIIGGYIGTQTCNSTCNGWNTCTTSSYCGDGILNGNEQCDLGSQNGVAGSGCSSTCQIENVTNPFCGDGIINQANETCDGGANCQIDCTCPLGYVADGSNGCIQAPTPLCGNGQIDQGELCDNGSQNGVVCDNSHQACNYCSSTCDIVYRSKKSTSSPPKITEISFLCQPNWVCSGWSDCENGIETRTCQDTNNCENPYGMPVTSTGCEIPKTMPVEQKPNNTLLWIMIAFMALLIIIAVVLSLMSPSSE